MVRPRDGDRKHHPNNKGSYRTSNNCRSSISHPLLTLWPCVAVCSSVHALHVSPRTSCKQKRFFFACNLSELCRRHITSSCSGNRAQPAILQRLYLRKERSFGMPQSNGHAPAGPLAIAFTLSAYAPYELVPSSTSTGITTVNDASSGGNASPSTSSASGAVSATTSGGDDRREQERATSCSSSTAARHWTTRAGRSRRQLAELHRDHSERVERSRCKWLSAMTCREASPRVLAP